MNQEIKYCLAKFIKFVSDELNISKPFKVTLSKKRSGDLKTYAYYQPSSGLIKVYSKDRGLADVLRSVAHELIHHQQNESGLLDKPQPDIGGKIEDDANSIAGQFVKKFGYIHPDFLIYDKKI